MLTTERQQFEAWFTNKYPRSYWGVEKTESGEYQGGLAAPLWEAWQESRGFLANREAQPVARVDRRPAASGGICWQHGGKDLPHGTELFTAPPAPAKANPVAWEMRYWNSGHNCWHDWERITAEQHAEMSVQHATSNDYEFRVLYDVPVAPAVHAAPDFEAWFVEKYKQTECLVKNEDGTYKFSGVQMAFSAWNACRAAMLGNIDKPAPQLDSVVTRHAEQPVGGGYKFPGWWIACSERMPELPKYNIPVLVALDGERESCEALYCQDGKFRWGVDENPIEDVTHWMPLPAAPEVSRDDA